MYIYKCVINTIIYTGQYLFSLDGIAIKKDICAKISHYSTSLHRVYKILIFKRASMRTLEKFNFIKNY